MILQMRRNKHTFQEIATTVECAPSYAHRIVTKHLLEVNALRVNEISLMITEMQQDYESLIRDHWPMRLQTEHAALILKAMQQLAKLRGLNAAERVEITNTLPATLEYVIDAEVVREME